MILDDIFDIMLHFRYLHKIYTLLAEHNLKEQLSDSYQNLS